MQKNMALGLDHMGVQKQMRKIDYLSDVSGQVGLSISTFLAAQITYFYTDKAGVAAATVAGVFLIVKILDAVSDILMGKIFDNTKSAKGKCAPWFLRMTIPAFICLITLFTVPKNLSAGEQFAYLLLTNILQTTVVVTAVSIPYNSLLSLRTNSVEERGKMSVYRSMVGMVIAIILSIVLIPLTNVLGGDQAAWIKLSIVAAIIVAISFFVAYKTSSNELSVEKKEEENISFVFAMKRLIRNKYWVLMLVLNVVSAVSYALGQSAGVYYTKWVLGNDNLVALIGGITLIPTFIGYTMVVPISKRIGMVNTIRLGYALSIAGSIARCIFPYSLLATIVAGSFVTFGTVPMMCFSGVMTNNITAYNEWKYDNKMVGMTNSVLSFGNKVSSGVGSALLGLVLTIGAYDGSLASQPASSIQAILAISIYIPLVVYIFMFILVKKFDLEKIYPTILKEIEERKINNTELRNN